MKLNWLVAVLVLAPFVLISFYNHPVGDDYWCTALVRKYGYWEAQLRLYDIVPPRYTELALSCLTPLSFGNFWGYKLIPAGFIVLFVLIIRWFLKVLTKNRMSDSDSYLLSLVFTGTYLAVLPGIGEGIYWASALSVYHAGIVLFVIWITFLFKWYGNGEREWYIFPGSCVSLAGILGCNEIIAIISFFVLAWIGVYRTLNRQKPGFFLLTMIAIIFLWVVAIMNFEGVSNRYNLVQADNSGKVFFALKMAALGSGYYVFKCLLNPFFWLGALISANSFARFSTLFYNSYRRFVGLKKYFFSLWAVVVFSIFFVIIFLSGLKPPLRISNMAVFFFLFGLIYCRILFSKVPSINIPRWVTKYKNAFLAALLILGMATKNNVSVAGIELLSGKASHYDREMNKRYEIIKSCAADTCVVPPLQHIPVTLRYSVEDRDPHISEYFGKTVVVSGK